MPIGDRVSVSIGEKVRRPGQGFSMSMVVAVILGLLVVGATAGVAFGPLWDIFIQTGESLGLAAYSPTALATAEAMSYAVSCSAIANGYSEGQGEDLSTFFGRLHDDMERTWNRGPTTRKVAVPCNASTGPNGEAFYTGESDIVVKCDPLGSSDPQCEVYNATLPQQFASNSPLAWLKGNGLPNYVLYYEALSKDVQKDYLVIDQKFKMWAVALAGGAALLPAAGKIAGGAADAGRWLASGASARLSGGILSDTASLADDVIGAARGAVGSKSIRPFLNSGEGLGGRYSWRLAKKGSAMVTRSGGERAVAEEFSRRMNTVLQQITRNSEEGLDALSRQRVREVVNDVDEGLASADETGDLVGRTGDDLTDDALRNYDGLSESGRSAYTDMIMNDLRVAKEAGDEFVETGADQAVRTSTERFMLGAMSAADDMSGVLFRGSADEVTENMANWLSRTEDTIGAGAPRVGKEALAETGRAVACRGFAARLASSRVATDAIETALDEYTPGDGWIDDTAGCVAFSGATGPGLQTVCRAAGVRNVPSVGGAGWKATSACAAMTALGVSAMQAQQRAIPSQPKNINSLYLQRPYMAPIEFPLSRYANWYFVRAKRGGSSDARFHFMSPMYTSPTELQDPNNPRIVVDAGSGTVGYGSSHIDDKGPGKDIDFACDAARAAQATVGAVRGLWGGDSTLIELLSSDTSFKIAHENVTEKGFHGAWFFSEAEFNVLGYSVNPSPCEDAQTWLLPHPLVRGAVNFPNEEGTMIHPLRPPGAGYDEWDTQMMVRGATDPNWSDQGCGGGECYDFNDLQKPGYLVRADDDSDDGDTGHGWDVVLPLKYAGPRFAQGARVWAKDGGIGSWIDLGKVINRDVQTIDVTFQGTGDMTPSNAQHNFGYQGSENEREAMRALFMVGPMILDGVILGVGFVLGPFSGGGTAAAAFYISSVIYSGMAEVANQGIVKDHAWPCHTNGCENIWTP